MNLGNFGTRAAKAWSAAVLAGGGIVTAAVTSGKLDQTTWELAVGAFIVTFVVVFVVPNATAAPKV